MHAHTLVPYRLRGLYVEAIGAEQIQHSEAKCPEKFRIGGAAFYPIPCESGEAIPRFLREINRMNDDPGPLLHRPT